MESKIPQNQEQQNLKQNKSQFQWFKKKQYPQKEQDDQISTNLSNFSQIMDDQISSKKRLQAKKQVQESNKDTMSLNMSQSFRNFINLNVNFPNREEDFLKSSIHSQQSQNKNLQFKQQIINSKFQNLQIFKSSLIEQEEVKKEYQPRNRQNQNSDFIKKGEEKQNIGRNQQKNNQKQNFNKNQNIYPKKADQEKKDEQQIIQSPQKNQKGGNQNKQQNFQYRKKNDEQQEEEKIQSAPDQKNILANNFEQQNVENQQQFRNDQRRRNQFDRRKNQKTQNDQNDNNQNKNQKRRFEKQQNNPKNQNLNQQNNLNDDDQIFKRPNKDAIKQQESLQDQKKKKDDFFKTKNGLESYLKLLLNKEYEKFDLNMNPEHFQKFTDIMNENYDYSTAKNILMLLRIVLQICSYLLNQKELENQTKEVLLLLTQSQFFFKDSLKKYRDLVQFVFKKDFGTFDNIFSLVDDLTNWSLINQKLIFLLPSKISQIPSEEIFSFSEAISSNVTKYTSLALSQNEKQLKVNYLNLLKISSEIDEQIKPYLESNNKKEAEKQIIFQEQQILYNIPNDFRKLTINPSIDELNEKEMTFLQPNKIIGPYDDLNQYLDTHFRLLKEDFSSDLKEGFQQFLQNHKKGLKLLINIYQYSVVQGIFIEKEFCGLRISVYSQSRQSWQQNNRFMYGQLVIFSDDQFFKNIFFGVVRQRDGKEMDHSQRNYGYVTIYIEVIDSEIQQQNLFEIFQSVQGKQIQIIESKSYFESYVHVLKCLQEIQQEIIPDNFFELIVNTNNDYNFPPSIWDDDQLLNKIERFSQINNFDLRQRDAFLSVFRQSISLIQGPPGTGKTFVGEKIVDFMLQTLKIKKGYSGLSTGPILLTCYTNHALDQFLEKIIDKTTNVIRLGGRSKIEAMKQFSLREVKMRNQIKRPKRYYFYKDIIDALMKRFKHRNNFFVQFCNMPIISNIKQLQDNDDILEQEIKNLIFVFGFQEMDSQQKNQLDNVFDYIYGWFNQIKNQFKIKLEQFIDQKIPAKYKHQKEPFIKYFAEKVNLFGNAHILDWLEILDFNLIYKKFIEVPLKKEEIQEEIAQNDYRFSQYERIFEDIENYKKSTNDLFEFLNNKIFVEKQNLSNIFERWEMLEGQYSENYNMRVTDFYEKMAQNKQQNDAYKLRIEDRWLLNFSLANFIKNNVQKDLEDVAKEIKKNKILMDKTVEDIDIELLQRQDIIAMTTTGAASHKKILSQIHSQIMVVEEAAEILESHVFTALNPNIQQLVLIGDQQQLRPKVNVHDLSKKYNMDISLFERLINNNFNFVKLQSQRRMRPEISEIIRQIYPDLQDNPDVLGRPSVKGMSDKNYFFYNHQFPEEELQSLQTKINPKEALMVVGLCQYLLQQNYQQSQITILTLYAGQLLTIRNIIKKNYHDQPINRVRVCNVDDYQGEENEIILLSLVRSNKNDQIGFLKTTNRICVALSRARLGLYIFGNASCLRNAALKLSQQNIGGQDHLWLKVIQILSDRNEIDDKIVLRCLNHNKETIIQNPEDFKNCPEGGCKEICNVRMECGHSCESCCHNYDNTSQDDPTGHNSIKCLKPCTKDKKCGHKCKWQCFQCKNGQFQGHFKNCQEVVSKILACNHENNYRCYQLQENEQVQCTKSCIKMLRCGHQCQRQCSFDCNKIYPDDLKKGYVSPCKQTVQKLFPCGHKNDVDCGLPIKNLKCESKCNEILECGHPCPKKCYQCQGQIFHGDCDRKCGKINPCNHECADKTCSKPCPPCNKKCTISCSHSKCPKSCGDPCVECKEKCKYKCDHSQCTKLCYEICDREPCNEPCKKSLKCGHPCIGFCGERCPDVCKDESCKQYDQTTFDIFFGNEGDEDARFVLLEDCGHAIEQEGLQGWLQSQNQSNLIKYPECPRCKKQIKNCPRIQEYLKIITSKVNNVKNKICNDQKLQQDQQITKEKIEEFEQKFKDYEKNLKNTFSVFQIEKVFQQVLKNAFNISQKKFGQSVQQIITVANTMNFCEELMDTLKFWNSQQFNQLMFITEQMKNLDPALNEIVKLNLHSERLEKIHRMIQTFDIILRLYNSQMTVFQDDRELKRILVFLIGKKLILKKEELDDIKNKAKQYMDNKAFNNMIIQAIGLSSGHWYECPNGHPYVIGECGGAMEVGRCSVCNAEIGGQGHNLNSQNRLSSFGGAQRPAWDPDNYENNLRAAQELNRQLNGQI